MENKPDKIVSATTESISTTTELVDTFEYPMAVSDDTVIVRLVPERWIKPDNTIFSDAYRPKPKAYSDTGLEKNVSTAPLSCYPTIENLETYKNSRRKHKIIEMRAQFPNGTEYPCIQDKLCHIGITGDMLKLVEDEETLEYFARNSYLLHPKP